MKHFFAFALLLVFMGASQAQNGDLACSKFQASHQYPGIPITISYVVTEDDSPHGGVLKAQVTHEGQGYVAAGFSNDGHMIGALSVIGLPDEPISDSNPGKYDLGLTGAILTDQQTIFDSAVVQNDTHTVLTFSKYLKEEGEIELNVTGSNYVLVAAGTSNAMGAHIYRASELLSFQSCENDMESGATEESTETGSTPVPSSVTSGATTYNQTETVLPPAMVSNEIINCSNFQSSYEFDGIPLTIDYVVTEDASPHGGVLKAQVTYKGQGYVAAGFSPDGRMIGALSVIGLPYELMSDSNPGKYDLGVMGAILMDQQTIFDSAVVQNDTHTVLTFSKYLKEEGEIELDPRGSNYVLVAAGTSNALGPHVYRASVAFPFQPCQEGQLASSAVTPAAAAVLLEIDDKKGLFKAHGVLAILAWGVLAPLAVANSMCRHWIPGQGLWFQLHRGMNILVLLFTIVSFVLVVRAMNETSGDNANHFQARKGAIGKHHTIGLVVMILVVVQSIAGILRPHTPAKGERPSAIRVLWEYGHRLCGMAMLAMGWYQCHSGLVLYAERFVNEKDYTEAFWAVTVTIMLVAFSGKIHGLLTVETKAPKSAKDSSDSDPATSTQEDELVQHAVDFQQAILQEVQV
jgi:cytochrome b561